MAGRFYFPTSSAYSPILSSTMSDQSRADFLCLTSLDPELLTPRRRYSSTDAKHLMVLSGLSSRRVNVALHHHLFDRSYYLSMLLELALWKDEAERVASQHILAQRAANKRHRQNQWRKRKRASSNIPALPLQKPSLRRSILTRYKFVF